MLPNPLRILVADDGRNAADIVGMCLEMDGHEVRVVYDGLAAIEAARGFDPHLVFLDITMPGVDGLVAARTIRGLPSATSPLIVTMSGHDENPADDPSSGVDRAIYKPIVPGDLRAMVDVARQRYGAN